MAGDPLIAQSNRNPSLCAGMYDAIKSDVILAAAVNKNVNTIGVSEKSSLMPCSVKHTSSPIRVEQVLSG